MPDWANAGRFLAFRLRGAGIKNDSGIDDNDLYIAGNTDIYDVTITVPSPAKDKKWYRVADTSVAGPDSIAEAGKEEPLIEQKRYVLPANGFVILMEK